MLKFIDILDNLDRALDAAEQTYAGESLIQGLILVRTQLLQTLKDEGLERIPVLGLPFDPSVSEAIGTEPVKEPEQDHLVIKELMRGYRLNGRVARAGRVVIGQHQPDAGGLAESAPAESAPAESAPAESAPAESAPAESAPAESAPAESGLAPVETPPSPAPAPDEDAPES